MLNYERIDNKTIVLSGATGLIGKSFIEHIVKRNIRFNKKTRIIALGRDQEKFEKRFNNLDINKYVVFKKQDVNYPIDIESKIDFVIHLASNTHPKLYASKPIETELTNIIGTKNMLDLASKNKGCIFFFMSSGDIYGDNDTGKMYLEEKDIGYIDCNTLRAGYIEGKRAGEALCAAYKEEKNTNYFIGRSCRVFGTNIQEDESKAISQFIFQAVKGEDIILKSSGDQVFSYLHSEDVVRAIIYILCNGEMNNAYNIADNEQIINLKDLALLISKYSGTKVVHGISESLEKKGSSNFKNVCLDSTKLNNLGWKPIRTLEDGIRETIEELKINYARRTEKTGL